MQEIFHLFRVSGKYDYYGNEYFSITDVGADGDNVLVDNNGHLYFIDPIIKFKKPAKDVLAWAGRTYGADGVGPEDTAVYRLREGEPPTKTGIGYKVFVMKDGKLYPPMVANPNGEATPVGVWLDADAAPVAGVTKTGRQQVKAGGKGHREAVASWHTVPVGTWARYLMHSSSTA